MCKDGKGYVAGLLEASVALNQAMVGVLRATAAESACEKTRADFMRGAQPLDTAVSDYISAIMQVGGKKLDPGKVEETRQNMVKDAGEWADVKRGKELDVSGPLPGCPWHLGEPGAGLGYRDDQ